MSVQPKMVRQAYALAQNRYAALGVDTELALQSLEALSVSMHCWQGDDVGGFEIKSNELGGGLAVTGNYPGRARTIMELRSDIDQALKLIPGRHRLNLHAFYGEFGGRTVDRNAVEVQHFKGWVDWAKERSLGLDFNPTCFSHPLAADGFTLSHPEKKIRQFWIEHCIACRKIGAAMGKALGSPAVVNVWIPDGSKDLPADRLGPRERLVHSLDAVFAEKLSARHVRDAVESKLFGLGSESYVVGSHEFYLGYAAKHQKVLCLDAGHFHPTESIADKISSVLMWVPEILLHVSRGVRWDSDHVVLFDDELNQLAAEIVRNRFLDRTHIGLDYFDASINRVAAWVIGMRNTLKAFLVALLEPAVIGESEMEGDLTSRLAWMEECKTLPWQAVWDFYCLTKEVPVGSDWLTEVKRYEQTVLSKRS
ncbi:MAG: L-rhamnose isomerase [Pirellulales bacterium]